jgi:hypothetical protein
LDLDNSKRTVFISWSKKRSKHVASALRSWLPNVIQMLDPWMSEHDLDVGSRWNNELARHLESADVAVICVTPENQVEPWLQFESGALGKKLDKSLVCPYLVGFDLPDLRFPLAMFQSVVANKGGTRRLLGTINKTLGINALGSEQLDDTFELWWPKLEEKLLGAPVPDDVPEPKSEKEMLRELVGLVRYLVADRSPEDRVAESVAMMKGLFQSFQTLGAPPLPAQFEDALRAAMAEALKPGAERSRDLLSRSLQRD